ncbi:ferredoxin [Streptomyces phaeochromogenes]|uniref:ferredoxin n=1 Tax=Streptomyces phaeochromogenes TaxID=1923 RepID=UPI0036A47235
MDISVNTGRCCSSGVCALTAPDVFDQSDEDGSVILLTVRPPVAAHAAVREAAELCPSGAIELQEHS